MAINELPDLAERIQVSLLNVMEERDIQVRGYTLRLPLDVLLVASANPEDYTNRGRIITPLKDRFGAEVRTHYPLELADEIALVDQEADLVAEVPRAPAGGGRPVHPLAARVDAPSTRVPACPPGSPLPPPKPWPPPRCAGPRSPAKRAPWPARSTSNRCPPCCAASWSSPPARRAASPNTSSTCCGAPPPRPRGPGCAASTSPPSPRPCPASPCAPGERVPAAEVVAALPAARSVEAVLTEVAKRLDAAGTEEPGPMASAAELALELLFLTRRLAKDEGDDDTVRYG